jgi:hypothetical protein
MINLQAIFNLPNIPTGVALNRLFPTVAKVCEEYALLHQAQWQTYAAGGVMPNGKRLKNRTGEYLRSIDLVQKGTFSWVCQSTLPYAKMIEEGAPAFDMHRYLQTSAKVRISQKGRRYLIIPFRHGTPGTVGFSSVMSPEVYKMARALAPSRITSVLRLPNQIGLYEISTRQPLLIPRNTYHWGNRLPAGLGPKKHAHHKTDLYAGLVRMKTEGGGTQYMTFRVMSEGSGGWIQPAKAGQYPNKQIANQLEAPFKQAVQAAAVADYRAWVRGR